MLLSYPHYVVNVNVVQGVFLVRNVNKFCHNDEGFKLKNYDRSKIIHFFLRCSTGDLFEGSS